MNGLFFETELQKRLLTKIKENYIFLYLTFAKKSQIMVFEVGKTFKRRFIVEFNESDIVFYVQPTDQILFARLENFLTTIKQQL